MKDWIQKSCKSSLQREEWSGSLQHRRLHTRMVAPKRCKIGLKKAIGEQVLTPFELQTCLVEVANLVNQRPIGGVPSDPDDGAYLCPNDVLLGRASSKVPQWPFRHTNNPRHRVEFVQKIVNSFWTRWTRDVFPSLLPRK